MINPPSATTTREREGTIALGLLDLRTRRYFLIQPKPHPVQVMTISTLEVTTLITTTADLQSIAQLSFQTTSKDPAVPLEVCLRQGFHRVPSARVLVLSPHDEKIVTAHLPG